MIYTAELSLSTKGFTDIINITAEVEKAVLESGVSEGLVTVSIPGSTAGVTTIEYEPGLIRDLKAAMEKIAPSRGRYAHDEAWCDGNGFSHVRAALLGASRSFPVSGGKTVLGTWQQIVLMDFDNRQRSRQVVVQVMGE